MARPSKNKDYIICERIKEARINAGLTQKQIADQLNIPLQTYKNWEQKRNIPNNATLVEIAVVLGVNIKWLMNADEKDIEKYMDYKTANDYKIEIKTLADYTTDELLAEIKRRFEAS